MASQAAGTGSGTGTGAAAPKPNLPYLYFCALTSVVGFFHYGYHLGELNNISQLLPCKSISVSDPVSSFLGLDLPPCIPMTTMQFSFSNGIYALAGTVGAVLAGPASQRFGRLRVFQALSLPFLLSPIALALANNYAWLLVGRFLAGLGTGGSATVIPVYLSEISPPALRGTIGNLSSAAIATGLAIAGTTGYVWASAPEWRWIVAFSLVTTVVQAALLPFCAQSPLWLMSRGRAVEARQAAAKLGLALDEEDEEGDDEHGGAADEDVKRADGPSSTSEATELMPTASSATPAAASPESSRNVTPWEFVTRREHRRSFLILLLAHMSQQFSGINVYFVYAFNILTLIFTPAQANLFYLILAYYNIPINWLPGLIVDRLGRRPLILVTMAGMALFAALFTVSVIVDAPVMSMIMFVAAVSIFALGLSNVPFILVAEVVPGNAIGAAASVAQVVNTLSSFVILFVFPLLLEPLGGYTFLFFTGYLVLAGIALAAILPETKGRSPSDVVAELRMRSGILPDDGGEHPAAA
ncbi:Bifunctional purine biosynthesis protein PurH [Blastocladiella emersonii ATCC 22665]|nr:Bifunctional purine biosynthesis protein PurH [Blastocladiella emersonii ATCC 22665]